MIVLAVVTLATFALGSHGPDWLPLRWQASNGPRDVDYMVSSVKLSEGILSVAVRRSRELALKQDPTIAPETNPWTWQELRVDCTQPRWRVETSVSLGKDGRVKGGYGGDGTWLPLESPSLADALRKRLCPAA